MSRIKCYKHLVSEENSSYMKNPLATILSVVIAATLFSSCDNDPDNLYGKKKEMQILDEFGDVATTAYASIYSGTVIRVIGGIGDNHIVEVEDEDILTAIYSGRGAMVDGIIPTETMPAQVILLAKKFGTSKVTITDTDIDQTVQVQVTVVNEYATLEIKESSVDGIEEGMKIGFIYGESNEYQIISTNGKEYTSSESGEYHWGEYNYEKNTLTLTLKNKDGETTWNITDADKNAAGHDWYVDEILTGLALPREEVLTKESPAVSYPTLFKFTDINNPDRYFKTGSSRSSANIKYNFN